MTLNTVEIAEHLITKFSHDLSGPVGALNNGVEFLKDDDIDASDKAIELLELSANEAVQRILFFRQLYGLVSSQKMLEFAIIRDIASDYLRQRKIMLQWNLDSGELDASIQGHVYAAKVALNMIYIVSQALITGGEITVSLDVAESQVDIEVVGTSDNVKLDPDVEKILKDGRISKEIDLGLKNVHMFYLHEILVNAGYKLQATVAEGNVLLEASFGK